MRVAVKKYRGLTFLHTVAKRTPASLGGMRAISDSSHPRNEESWHPYFG